MNDENSPVRVLIADCNVDAAEILGILLGGHGFRVKIECDKVAVLRTAQYYCPHAVLIDLGQDSMDTFEVAVALRSLPELGSTFLVTLSHGELPTPLLQNDVRIDVRLTKPAGYKILIDILKCQFGV